MITIKKIFKASFFRFLVVGSVAAIVHYGLYLLLLNLLDVNIAYSVGFIVAFICNWLMTSYYTFRQKLSYRGLIGMFVAQGVNYVIHIVLLSLWLWTGVPKWLAPVAVYAIAVPISFILMRFIFVIKVK